MDRVVPQIRSENVHFNGLERFMNPREGGESLSANSVAGPNSGAATLLSLPGGLYWQPYSRHQQYR